MDMKRGPRDDTVEYADRTQTQARLERDYLQGDIRGVLIVIVLAVVVTGLGALLMWLVL
jgi:hypothetical protein